jgi:integrase
VARRASGTGSIYPYRRNGEVAGYAAQLVTGWVDGKPTRKTVYGRTVAEVTKKLEAAKRQAGIPTETATDATVADYFRQWLEDARGGLEASTYTRYEQYVRVHLLPALGKHPLAALQPRHLADLYRRKLAEGLSPRTVLHLHRTIHTALARAVRWGTLPRNVATLVQPPKVATRDMRTLALPEARRLIAAIRDEPLEALYLLALTSGMREGELLALRWSDVDLSRGVIAVQRKVRRQTGQGKVEGPPKTRRSRRPVVLTAICLAALKRHRARPECDGAGLVFPSRAGTPLEASNLRRRHWYPLLERLGLPRLVFHQLRHSNATLLLELGVHPAIVSSLLGHSDVNVTLNTYSHVLPSMGAGAMALLDRALQPNTEPEP